jgi:cyclophilin family peptidyl-prolyl cis-trans isomerase
VPALAEKRGLRKEIAGMRQEKLPPVTFMQQFYDVIAIGSVRALCISFMTATATLANERANHSLELPVPMRVPALFARVCMSVALTACMLSPASVVAQEAAAAPAAVPVAPAAASPENILNLDLSTGGRVTIQLYPEIAPAHVERIKALTRQGFYNGVVFHRVIDGFMAQTGDPKGTGEGGSELPDLKAEFNKTPHLRGTVSMARTNEPDTANSQFFICFQPRFSLDNKYTVFGRVTSGMQFVDAIERGEPPASPSKVLQASIAADNVAPPAFAPAATPATEAPITVDQLSGK